MKYIKQMCVGALGFLGIMTLTGNTDTNAAQQNTLDLSDVRVADACALDATSETGDGVHSDDDDDVLFAGCGGVS